MPALQPPPSAAPQAVTALDLLQATPSKSIVTFCQPLDSLLGGGIPCGEVTELCECCPETRNSCHTHEPARTTGGIPGVGKTQLCMQVAADAMVPTSMGGVGGGALYIDTEGSFMVPRQAAIAKALCSHLASMGSKVCSMGPFLRARHFTSAPCAHRSAEATAKQEHMPRACPTCRKCFQTFMS